MYFATIIKIEIQILKAAKLVGKKYDISDLRDVMTTGLGFSQDYLDEIQANSAVDEMVSKMNSLDILKTHQTVKCEICEAIFAGYNGMTAFELLQLHKQNKHTDNVIGATYFKRRIEPGVSKAFTVKDSIFYRICFHQYLVLRLDLLFDVNTDQPL